ncbi:unnamed protein product [Cuscuta epithymum]|uniref:Uncharacterized protein n=1 Tax=Cuscuta epithymum TaxID=186058 RepID=A0AAV0FZL1_9ASTE|nr:unnamed protein product [Cuscuta epithymum]
MRHRSGGFHSSIIFHNFGVQSPSLKSLFPTGSEPQKQIALDGPVICGKCIALTELIHWAHEEI